MRERNGVAETIYRVHEADGPTASPPFHAAARSPRLIETSHQLLRDHAPCVYHTKCNLKTAIDGSVWQWHQDYGSWKRDGVPRPDLTTALVMLDAPTEIGGCLYVIPGSHTAGGLVVWDNRCTMHRGLLYDETLPRDLRRVTKSNTGPAIAEDLHQVA